MAGEALQSGKPEDASRWPRGLVRQERWDRRKGDGRVRRGSNPQGMETHQPW